MRRNKTWLVCGLAAAAVWGAPSLARACGGCFHAPPDPVTVEGGTESTVVTGHRMVMSITPERTVLWDQIEYAGDPEEFSWVLPVKAGAYIEVGDDAWIDVLDAATATTVGVETLECMATQQSGGGFSGGGDSGFGCGCGSDDASGGGDEYYGGGGPGTEQQPPDPVTVVSQATVGPYETVTLSTDQPGALNDWLESHGYVVPEAVQPKVDEYVAEGFDFIALRLVPGTGVQRMAPVRVVMPGAGMTLPLRLVAAGTGANTALTLFVISEGRYEVDNFDNVLVPQGSINWDYAAQGSNYATRRAATLAQNDGQSWLTSYARRGTLLSPVIDGAADGTPQLSYGNATTIAGQLFAELGAAASMCTQPYSQAAGTNAKVVDNCDDMGNCAAIEDNEISASELGCQTGAGDLLAATIGMHLGDVWLTRLEANLPQEAFDRDLVLRAAPQDAVYNRFLAASYSNPPCEPADVTPAALWSSGKTAKRRQLPGGLVGLTLLGLGATLAARRRRRFVGMG
jgi:Uncharacterized protein conserved in bacteria (DUF2330)